MSIPPPPGPETPQGPSEGGITKDEMLFAMLSHILAIFTGFLGPLIIWLIKKDESQFVAWHAAESLNFQITMIIAWVVLFAASIVTCGIGAFLYIPLYIFIIVYCIIIGMKANSGQYQQYPLTLRLIK